MAKFGTKTLIAVAVATASTYANAQTFDVAGPDRLNIGKGAFEQIILKGQAARGVDGIDFDTPDVAGDFVNNADFNLNGAGVDAIGIDTELSQDRSKIGGSFINNGSISATGAGASGILISDTNIGKSGVKDDALGNIENNGTISIIDNSGAPSEDAQGGITVEHSNLYGDVVNKSTISVIATDAHGIRLDGRKAATSVHRDVINKGTIDVQGRNAQGLALNSVTLGNREAGQRGTDVINEGTIRAQGQNATAVMLDSTDFHNFENKGTIDGRGQGSVGLHIHNSGHIGEDGIANSGRIHGDAAGIRITDASGGGLGNHFIKMFGGTISSPNKAIEGNGQTDVDLYGGTIIGDVTGIAEAFVSGNVTVHSSLFDAKELDIFSGNLYFAEVHAAVSGDMTVSQGAGVTVRVSDSANSNQGLVQAGGKVVLEKGSVVSVNANKGEFTKNSTRYVLISADELVNLGASVISATPLLTVTNSISDGKNLTANVGLATGAEAVDGLKRMGANRNTLQATQAFVDGVLANLPTDSALYKSFMSVEGDDLVKLAGQLNPEINGGTQAASMAATGLTSSAVTSRAASVGANSGEALVDTGAWVKVLDGNTDQGTRGGVAGYDADSQGIVVGADGKIDDQTTIGFAFSHIITDVSSDNGNKTDVKSNILTAYGAWEDGPLSVIGSLSYGKSDNESKRYIAGESAKADYDSRTIAADVIGGYKIDLDDKFSIQPQIGARYTQVKIDGFTEKGSAAALETGSQKIEVFDIGAGMQFAADLGDFKPTARLMAYRDLARDTAQTTSAFVMGGNTFVTSGADATKWTYEAGVGVDWSNKNYTVSANYDYARKADFNADTLSMTFRWDF